MLDVVILQDMNKIFSKSSNGVPFHMKTSVIAASGRCFAACIPLKVGGGVIQGLILYRNMDSTFHILHSAFDCFPDSPKGLNDVPEFVRVQRDVARLTNHAECATQQDVDER